MKLLRKAYWAGRKQDMDNLGTPMSGAMVFYGDSRNEVKGEAMWEYDLPYIEVYARRFKEKDQVLFDNIIVSRAFAEDLIYCRDRLNEWRKEMSDFIKSNPNSKVYIWSGQWMSYWMSEGNGYTKDIGLAGVYDINDAWSRVSHVGPEKKISFRLVPEAKEIGRLQEEIEFLENIN